MARDFVAVGDTRWSMGGGGWRGVVGGRCRDGGR